MVPQVLRLFEVTSRGNLKIDFYAKSENPLQGQKNLQGYWNRKNHLQKAYKRSLAYQKVHKT